MAFSFQVKSVEHKAYEILYINRFQNETLN